MTSLGVTPSAQGRASVSGGVASFPITGGHVTVYKPGAVDPYVQGRIVDQGSGLNLAKGATTVSLRDFVIDPGKPAFLTGEVLANGKVVASSTKLFDLDGSTLKPITTNTAAGTATLTGTTVRLSAGAATALNGAFKTTAIKGGTVIGIATIVVNLPIHPLTGHTGHRERDGTQREPKLFLRGRTGRQPGRGLGPGVTAITARCATQLRSRDAAEPR